MSLIASIGECICASIIKHSRRRKHQKSGRLDSLSIESGIVGAEPMRRQRSGRLDSLRSESGFVGAEPMKHQRSGRLDSLSIESGLASA
jgi:hypothetical protein